MRVFDFMGTMASIISKYASKIGYKNINCILNHRESNKINIVMKDGTIAQILMLEPGQRAVVWSPEDFELEARSVEDEKIEILYDRDRFHAAIRYMIEDHNADIGITWQTVREYLNRYCLLDNNKNEEDLIRNE